MLWAGAAESSACHFHSAKGAVSRCAAHGWKNCLLCSLTKKIGKNYWALPEMWLTGNCLQTSTAPHSTLLLRVLCRARTWLLRKSAQEPQQLCLGNLLCFWSWKYLYGTESNSSWAFASNILLCSLELRKHFILERVNPSGCNTCKWAGFVQGKLRVLILWGIRRKTPWKTDWTSQVFGCSHQQDENQWLDPCYSVTAI